MTRLAVAGTAPLTINGVVDRGGVLGQHTFELYGDYPGYDQVRSVVKCNGKPTLSKIDYASRGQINVFIAEPPGGAACTFTLQRLTDGISSQPYGPLQPSAPEIEILGVKDRGTTDGRRFVELYGRFPDSATLEPRALCAGVTAAARSEYASSGQINVSMPDLGPTSRCSFTLRRRSDGRESPVWNAGAGQVSGPVPGFGAYWWGGLPPKGSSTLAAGQTDLARAGFDVARMVLTPIIRSGNPADNWYADDLAKLARRCPLGVEFLPCMVRTPTYRKAISIPTVRTVILTTYDATSVGPLGGAGGFVDRTFLAANAEAVRAEYRDLTVALYEVAHDSGKTFVVGNWETDNSIYCGSAYGYVIDPKFRSDCDNSPNPPARGLDGITLWFQLRQQGIAEGRAIASARGLGGMFVGDGVEFNSAHFMQNAGLRTTLADIIPQVRPSFATYSSYDSQYTGTMTEDLALLRSSIAPSELLIGEVGFPQHGIDGIDAFRTVETAKAIQRARLRAAVLWVGFDGSASGHVQPYGVLDGDGRDRPVMQSLRAELAAQARDLASPSDLRIDGVVDRGLTAEDGGTYRYFELYGAFAGNPTPTVVCDGTDALAEVRYASAGQVNARIPHDWRDRYCIFRVGRPDGAHSLDFGPKLAAASGR